MTPNDLFERAASSLREKTTLTEPQARGSLRLALKHGGCSAYEVTAQQLTVIFRTVMPKVLAAQGIAVEQAKAISEQIAANLAKVTTPNQPDAATFMFDRVDRATNK